MAVPTYVNAGALAAVNSGSVSPALPASIAAGDLLIMSVMTNAANTFPSDPGSQGWTKMLGEESDGNQSAAWYWRRAVSSDSGPTFTSSGTALSNSNGLYARIEAYTGVLESGTPVEDVTLVESFSTDTAPTTASVDSTVDDCLCVSLLVVDDDPTFSLPPSGWTTGGTRVTSTTGGDCAMASIYKSKATAGNEASVSYTTLGTAEAWKTCTFFIQPSAPSLPPRHAFAVLQGVNRGSTY